MHVTEHIIYWIFNNVMLYLFPLSLVLITVGGTTTVNSGCFMGFDQSNMALDQAWLV